MNKSAAILILASFLTISIFGIFSMAAPEHHSSSFNACVGSLTRGIACPNNSPSDSIAFHLNSFRVLSTSLLNSGLAGVLALMSVLMSVLLIFFVFFTPFYLALTSIISRRRIFETSYQPFKREKIFWSSLHENSPALVSSFRLSANG